MCRISETKALNPICRASVMVATEIVSTRISRPLRSSAPNPVEAHVATHQEVEILDPTRRLYAAGRGIAPDDQGKRHALHADDDRERPDDERVQIELEGRRE